MKFHRSENIIHYNKDFQTCSRFRNRLLSTQETIHYNKIKTPIQVIKGITIVSSETIIHYNKWLRPKNCEGSGRAVHVSETTIHITTRSHTHLVKCKDLLELLRDHHPLQQIDDATIRSNYECNSQEHHPQQQGLRPILLFLKVCLFSLRDHPLQQG
jgi:hypothetical protein